eukprot:gene24374-29622_t
MISQMNPAVSIIIIPLSDTDTVQLWLPEFSGSGLRRVVGSRLWREGDLDGDLGGDLRGDLYVGFEDHVSDLQDR